MFQFHKGTIKTAVSLNILKHLTSFNSIKVRLRQGVDDKGEYLLMFQFHKGTIKTLLLLLLLLLLRVSIP